MEAIKKQVTEIQSAWADVYKAMRASPTAWQPHLPGFFAEQIDEVVSTISQWLGKVDPPEGFKPAFHLAQGLVTTSLPQLLTTVKNLQKGEYNYLPSFVSGLNQILSALHSMVVYSSKYDAKHIAADLAAQLAESLSLLGTAQEELRKKADLLNSSSDIAKETERRATAINDLEQKAAKLVQDTITNFTKLSSDIQNQSTKILGDTNANAVKLTAALEATITKTSADMEAKVTQLNSATEKKTTELINGLTAKANQSSEEVSKIIKDINANAVKLAADLEAAAAKASADIEVKVAQNISATEKKATDLINGLMGKTNKSVEEIEASRESVKKTAEEVVATSKECDELKKQIEDLLKKNASLDSTLNTQSIVLEEMQKKSVEQQKLIKELLPDAASAGLAAGFEARANSLQNLKIVWMTIFIVSIFSLLGVSIWLAHMTYGKEGVELWKAVLERLPFAAPIIWLGWFSAIQYGNTIRVQEDYAFKAATSKAFAGYKDHMEYMANVQLDEGNNAMKLLAARTIEILAHEPLRIYQKPHKDVSPTNSLLSLFGPKEKKEKVASQ